AHRHARAIGLGVEQLELARDLRARGVEALDLALVRERRARRLGVEPLEARLEARVLRAPLLLAAPAPDPAALPEAGPDERDDAGRRVDVGREAVEVGEAEQPELHLGADARRDVARDRAAEIDRVEHHDRVLDDAVRGRIALRARIGRGLEADALGD